MVPCGFQGWVNSSECSGLGLLTPLAPCIATLPRLIAFLRAFEAEGVPTGFMGTHESEFGPSQRVVSVYGAIADRVAPCSAQGQPPTAPRRFCSASSSRSHEAESEEVTGN